MKTNETEIDMEGLRKEEPKEQLRPETAPNDHSPVDAEGCHNNTACNDASLGAAKQSQNDRFGALDLEALKKTPPISDPWDKYVKFAHRLLLSKFGMQLNQQDRQNLVNTAVEELMPRLQSIGKVSYICRILITKGINALKARDRLPCVSLEALTDSRLGYSQVDTTAVSAHQLQGFGAGGVLDDLLGNLSKLERDMMLDYGEFKLEHPEEKAMQKAFAKKIGKTQQYVATKLCRIRKKCKKTRQKIKK